jgi:hypothetical protein
MAIKEAKRAMSEDELKQLVMHQANDAIDYATSELSWNRGEAQKYYFGKALGNEEEGKSKVVSKDVSDSIDWMLPGLMKIFAGNTERAVMFEPRTEEDVEQAEQETDWVNYVMMRKNNGFSILHDWFKDALLHKNGIVKSYVEEVEEVTTEIYSGLDELDLQLLLNDDNTNMVEMTELEDGMMDVKLNKVEVKREIKVVNVPPEEFLIERRARSLEDSNFTAHRRRISRSDLRKLGVEESILEDLNWQDYDRVSTSKERVEREAYNGNYTVGDEHNTDDEANRAVWVTEAYIKCDFDGDGIAEFRRVLLAGEHFILSNDEWDVNPFSTVTPTPIQHQFFGQSVFDQLKDIQEVKTALLRNYLDAVYISNNPRYIAVEGQVNLSDLENNTPGGVVRERMAGALRPMEQPALPQDFYGFMEYWDKLRTNRTGVSERSQGLDDKVLNSHTSASQVNKVMSVAEQRLELIARIFAETGVKDLFQKIHALSIKHPNKKEMFRLRGKFVRVNPASWDSRTDLVVTVGIGNTDKDQQAMHLQRLAEMQQTVVNNGGLGILTDRTKIYNLLKEMSANSGFRDVTKFWLDPSSPESVRAVQELDKSQAEAAQMEKATKQSEIAVNQAKAEKDNADAQVLLIEAQIKAKEAGMTEELQRFKMELDDREIALRERGQALEEEKQGTEDKKFSWKQNLDLAELTLEKEQGRNVSIGGGKIFKGRNAGESSSGNTGGNGSKSSTTGGSAK